ncbi:phosphotransferase family protein [Nocardioides dongkuii]|uniref:phosphotransferase family protein n=1 Tax=Nocardioides dongkuii TaxID=2760089 RepID=UPI001877E54D|nr:phosphotransferase [Nocardioides dongkuii]
MPTTTIAPTIEEITPAWLSEALGRPVSTVTSTPVGTGQMAVCHRLTLDGGETLLAKLPAADPAYRAMVAGTYYSEVRFYAEIADTVAIRVPACSLAVGSPVTGDFTLLLEDLAPAEPGEQLAGCTPDQARDAVVNLAGLHGPRWCDPSLLDTAGFALSTPEEAALLSELLAPATETFIEGLGELVSPEDRDTLRAAVDVIERWALARTERFGLVHGDYRLDNMMFAPGGGVAALDWQTLSLGLPARDLSFFVGTSLGPGTRRATERDLVAAYHAALVGHGVTSYSLEECWDDYRFAMLQGPLISVFGCAYGTRTERGDRMFATMVARSCAAVRDLGTLALVR